MNQAQGYKSQVLIDFENVFKTDNSPAHGRLVPFNSINLSASQNQSSAATLTGRRDSVAPFYGNISADGNIVVPVDVRNFGYWLKGLLGSPTTTGSSAPFTHVFKTLADQPSMIIEKFIATDTPTYEKYNGVKIDSMDISIGGDGELTATMALAGCKSDIQSTSYDAAPSVLSFKRFGNFQASIKENGTLASSVIETISVKISTGLDKSVYCIGDSGERSELPSGIMACTGTISALFKDTTLLNKAKNNTRSSLEIIFSNGTDSLSFKMPEVEYKLKTPEVSGAGGIKLSLDYVAFFDTNSDNTMFMATLINDQDATVYGG